MSNATDNKPAIPNPIDQGKEMQHHGEFIKSYLEQHGISRSDFQSTVGKSHAWLYDLFGQREFNTQQIALVSMTLGIDPTEFGFQNPLLKKNALVPQMTYYSTVNTSVSYDIKIMVENLNDRYQKLEHHLDFLQELLSDSSKIVNQQSKMLERKDDIIYSIIDSRNSN